MLVRALLAAQDNVMIDTTEIKRLTHVVQLTKVRIQTFVHISTNICSTVDDLVHDINIVIVFSLSGNLLNVTSIIVIV